jgi:hypothetical protein
VEPMRLAVLFTERAKELLRTLCRRTRPNFSNFRRQSVSQYWEQDVRLGDNSGLEVLTTAKPFGITCRPYFFADRIDSRSETVECL